MEINFKHILEGWTKATLDIFGKVSPPVKEMSAARMEVCNGCELITATKICNPVKKAPHSKTGELTPGCGCSLSAKIFVPNAECPLGKWEHIKLKNQNG